MADICAPCLQHLQHGRVPKESLFNFDSGDIPDGLLPLQLVEEAILSVLRPFKYTVFCKPEGNGKDWRPNDSCHPRMVGHVIAVPNPPVDELAELLVPCHPDALPEFFDAVLLAAARTREHAEEMAKRVKILQV
jgi:hypothetical protein